jgi:hypothetical protein
MELLRSADRGCPLCSLIIGEDRTERSEDSYLDDLDENSDSALRDSQIYISVITGELGEAQDLFIEQDLEGNDGRNLASSRFLIRLSIRYEQPHYQIAVLLKEFQTTQQLLIL